MATSTSPAKRTRKNRASESTGPGGPWSKAAPRTIRQQYDAPTSDEGWKLWRKHLAKRKSGSFARLFKGRTSPLLWALPAGADVEQAERLVELLRRPGVSDLRTAGLDNAVLCWLSRAEVARPDFGFALECLAWAAVLPELAEHLAESAWWQLTNRLVAIAGADGQRDDPLAAQLIHGELAATLARQLPEVEGCRALTTVSRETLDEANGLFQDKTTIRGGRLANLRPLLACWTRLRVISQDLDVPVWTDSAPRRYSRLLEQVLRLSRRDGTQLFAPADAPALNRRLLKTALALADTDKTRRLARLIRGRGPAGPKPRRRLPSPSFESESAAIALLRPDWQRRSPQWAIDYNAPQLAMELSLGNEQVLSGAVETDVRVDGRPLVARQPWEQICWESDGAVDYLELELMLAEDISIQRHMLLARRDGVLFLADAVLGVVPRQIEYRCALPLADGVSFTGETETREGTLAVAGRTCARVFPLALGEWRSGPSCGTLEAADGKLQLSQQAGGQSLFAPLFIDLDRRRLRQDATWRQLTVGEDRQVVPHDQAVGYRVQVGKAQWVVYRSLVDPGVRTVLGKNLMHEFLLGRFRKNGKIKTLLEIEV